MDKLGSYICIIYYNFFGFIVIFIYIYLETIDLFYHDSLLPYCYTDVFSGVDRSGPFSIRYGALPRAQTRCFKVENSLTVMLV